MLKMPLWSSMPNWVAEKDSFIKKPIAETAMGFLFTIFTSNSVQVKE